MRHLCERGLQRLPPSAAAEARVVPGAAALDIGWQSQATAYDRTASPTLGRRAQRACERHRDAGRLASTKPVRRSATPSVNGGGDSSGSEVCVRSIGHARSRGRTVCSRCNCRRDAPPAYDDEGKNLLGEPAMSALNGDVSRVSEKV